MTIRRKVIMLSWIESNTLCPRLAAAMILSGSAVQTKGFGCWIGGFQLNSRDAGFYLYRKWLTYGQMVCPVNDGNFRFLSASSKSDTMRPGAGGCHVEVPHWNCRCRSDGPAVECGHG